MPQTVADLKLRVQEMAEIFSSILAAPGLWQALGDQKQQQLTTGVNKAYGQARSFQHEYLTTTSAQVKGRNVVTQIHADVTIGAADALFAKSVECKNVTKPEKGAVNKVVTEALDQLAGNTGHTPRTDDVRIIDLRICGNENPWPLQGGTYGTPRAASSLAQIRSGAIAELKSILESDKAGALALRKWLQGETLPGATSLTTLRGVTTTTPVPNAPPKVTTYPNSTRPVAVNALGGIQKVRCLTIKVRYDPPYPLSDAPLGNEAQALQYLVVQAYNTGGGVSLKEAKASVLKVQFSVVYDPAADSLVKKETGRATQKSFS